MPQAPHGVAAVRRAIGLVLFLLAAGPSGPLQAAGLQVGYGYGSGNVPGDAPPVVQAAYGASTPTRPASEAVIRARSLAVPLRVNNTYVVTTTADTGSGSLRAAIEAANMSPGLDQITFFILAGGVQTIAPTIPLPTITDPLVIDGTTQPGYAGSPLIELTGSSAGPDGIGLHITGGNSTVRGLIINRWATSGAGGYGIALDNLGNNVIEGNYIGTDASGVFAAPNAVNGVAIFGASTNNRIGGTTAAARNVISGNASSGIQIGSGNAGHNIVRGNYIGLNAFGSAAVPNGGNGVFTNSPDNIIGGTGPGARNVISANLLPGIFIGVASARTIVQGNYIGTDATGSADIGNQQNGIFDDGAPDNVIGDSTFAARNVIAGNQYPAVYLSGFGATGNRVQGNFLCVDRTGGVALGDGNCLVISSGSNNLVGGATPAARNVMSGTPNTAVALINTASNNRIIGNYIGTDSSGTAPVPTLKGVLASSVLDNFIGGLAPGEGNVISGNTTFGIELRTAGTTRVFGNLIGTDKTGGVNMGNGSHGVVFTASASLDSVIQNVIAFNHGAGIYDSSGTQNVFRRNDIFENSALGIDLYPAGLSPNDSLDSDAGVNDLTNFPVLDSASVSNGQTGVYGHLDARPNRSYVVEYFASQVPDPSHFGEGGAYLGSEVATTDSSGRAILVMTLPALTLNVFVTATATDTSSATTSEFSPALCLNDTDGDGIWDCWETEGWGIDVNADGVTDLDLYARGARPGHKDLFVEIDAMTGHGPPPAALAMVQAAFSNVPNSYLHNPDGQPGIALHYILDETDVPVQDLPNMWGDFQAVKDAHFGTVAERQDPNHRYILQAKRLVYRYGLWGRTFCSDRDTLASGVGELGGGLGGDDFMVSFGSQGVCGWRDTNDVALHAGTFMHELGHTLGLRHGGGDDVLFKPNYYSVMNYMWTSPEPRWQAPNSWRLDYSPYELPLLDEEHLNESQGLGVPAGVWPKIVSVPYLNSQLKLSQAKFAPGEAVDWSGDSTINPGSNVMAHLRDVGYGLTHCDGTIDMTLSPPDALYGWADWSNLKYNFRDSPDWRNTGYRCGEVPTEQNVVFGTDPPLQEMTPDMLQMLGEMPAPRPEGEFVMDGALDPSAQLLASNDGIDLYAAYRTGQLYVATEAAPTQGGDVIVFVAGQHGALTAAPLGKSGQVGAWTAYLANQNSDNRTDWADESQTVFTSIAVDSAGGFAEGVVDVGLLFGEYPSVLSLAAGRYGTTPGGALLAQAPAGNGDANLDGDEYADLASTTDAPAAEPLLRQPFLLSSVTPNPVVGRARAVLTLREATEVDVAVQDVSGRRISTLAHGFMSAGRHELILDPGAGTTRLAPGVYFLAVRALGGVQATRLVILR